MRCIAVPGVGVWLCVELTWPLHPRPLSPVSRGRGEQCGSVGEDFGEEADPVAVHDGGDVGWGVAAVFEELCEFLEVAEAVEVAGRLFDSVTAVEVAADADVAGVSGQLADDVDVFDSAFHADQSLTDSPDISWLQHDDVEGDPDDSVTFDDGAVLFVGELALPWGQSAGVLVAGVDASAEVVEELPEGDVRQVCDIDCDTELFDAFEEWYGVKCESDFAGCPAAVPIGSVVCESDGAEAVFVEFADGIGYEDGVSSFHGLDEAEGGL